MPRNAIEEAARLGRNVVIVDTAGRLQIDTELMDELRRIRDTVQPQNTLLVVDAMTGQEAVNVAESFHETIGLDGVILTKIDGDARGGAALSVKEVIGKPILFAGTGEKLEDFEPFHPDRMASRILGMGDVLTLIEKAEAAFDDRAARAGRGDRPRRDVHARGLPRADAAGEEDGTAAERARDDAGHAQGAEERRDRRARARPRSRRSSSSMTPYERRKPDVINGSRRARIAKGSGVRPSDVNSLLKQFKQVQQMMRGFAPMMKRKGKKGKRGKAADLRASGDLT